MVTKMVTTWRFDLQCSWKNCQRLQDLHDINRQVKCNFQVPQSLSHDSEAFWPFIYKLFGLVFFVLKSLLGIARQQSHEKFTTLSVKPRSHVRILMYQKVDF